ncbi:PREDICTED: kinesin-like protein KIF6 [Nicrophorus vespilloides]|uniref:Kinesin-like protein KIF6 n=1 Tax=Nicrophorus vespilloides TaxID=110193 RepID=A0ABM1NKI4_NICVS|nr:PREDICTED: kinesin-like protein KIF6 [Nicrophorus vespilloides]XP_017787335.1 PREDICTED: kinesin-like protein KIF6 [Nicrophorus vespilloides]
MKSRINVYARIRREDVAKRLFYGVDRSSNGDTLTLHQPEDDHRKKRISHRFRFQRVFDLNSDQKDVFESIAVPIIDKTMDGRNGTIFAYGPTGSGKTYSLTGSHSNYEKRGLIPRTIEYIFKFLTETNGRYIVYLSFLEIYNETAYDLLNPKRTFESGAEELP